VSAVFKYPDLRLIGRSEALRAVEREIETAARSDAKVLITGETGTGKEVVARLIHRQSRRASAPLVVLNCAGLPDTLLESELFGHARGSFTGAYADKPGLLEQAPNGTVFLDEVGEMSVRMQAVLLRFLETGEIQRVGADRAHTRANVRVIAATNSLLEKAVKAGTFREDLFFRLNVVRIQLPPLRDREADVALLVDYFLGYFADIHRMPRPELTDDALTALIAYRWPGNVRELKNVVERIVSRARGRRITASDLQIDFVPAAMAVPSSGPAQPNRAEELAARMLDEGESFWSAVHPLFMSRDLTRAQLRKVIQIGLQCTNGNYRMLVRLFNMPPDDYKRFLGFLRKYDCHLPFQRFRTIPSAMPERELVGAGAGPRRVPA
jgi:transcriptional regulator with GAF, ATPase, and Fis domain